MQARMKNPAIVLGAGGPIVATLRAAWTLTASGTATIALALITATLWTRRRPASRQNITHQPNPPARGPERADQIPEDGKRRGSDHEVPDRR